MMRALILHGTSAEPMSGWRPWLKGKLEADGYEVWVPQLPDNDRPSYSKYNDFIFESDWDLAGSLVVGHSSGAVEVLNLLMDDRSPRIKLGIMVSAWYGSLRDETPEMKQQMSGIFPPGGYDFDKIRSKADRLVLIHSDNDPYCPLEQVEIMAQELGAELYIISTDYGSNADHLGSPLTELPELWSVVRSINNRAWNR